MRRALISDIHGNLEALDVVLGDIAGQRINEIICLGDVVGYGPNPRECIDRVMERCRITLLGNHDMPADWKNGWTSRELTDPSDHVKNEIRKAFLTHLPRSHEIGSYLFVHGSPGSPLSEYVFPEDIYNHRKMERLFSLVRHHCFQGHTHVPGIITENFEHFTPDEIDDSYDLGEVKLMINVGSVGQPRDGDDRACYVILDDGPKEDIGSPRITYRRLPYYFETTIRKIRPNR